MDEELFKLCKEVERRTGWKDTELDWCRNDGEEWSIWNGTEQGEYSYPGFEISHAAYTSDYLLEKLPRHLNIKRQVWHLLVMNGDVEETNWIADYVTVGRLCWLHDKEQAKLTEADTPLKALLKLVLALHDAGQLQAGDE